MQKYLIRLLLIMLSLLVVGCGGGGGNDEPTPKEAAIQTISDYASGRSAVPPTVQDYVNAGATTVNDDNLDEINDYIESLDDFSSEDLDKLKDSDRDGIVNGLDPKPDNPNNSNMNPTAQDSSYTFAKNSVNILTLKATDGDGDPLTYAISQNPTHGHLTGTAPNMLYTPDDNYTGGDSFTFSVSDGYGGSDSGTVTITISDIADSTSSFIHTFSKGDTGDYTIHLGSAPSDVYLVFSNQNTTSTDSQSSISHNAKSAKVSRKERKSIIPVKPKYHISRAPQRAIDLRNKIIPPAADSPLSPQQKRLGVPPKKQYDVVGDATRFQLEQSSSSDPDYYTDAHAKKVIVVSTEYGDKRLNIWVSDDSFGSGCDKSKCVTQEMVNSLADAFLKAGSDNDVYDWVTHIYGQEWGSDAESKYSNLIPAYDEITILITDIDRDDSKNGGTIGYFYAKDNYKKTELSGSNERIMFYIDGVMFANEEGGDDSSWSIHDPWPMEMLSTLAHEFQHMINFYQKTTLLLPQSSAEETWLNEMLSETTEDIVATRLHHQGPRAVAYTDGSAGVEDNEDGRYPIFNQNNTLSLTSWNNTYADYSKVSAFGAFLVRNYGGAKLLHDIQHNSYTDAQAVVDAVHKSTHGAGKSFEDLLREWSVAVMLSDKTTPLDDNGYSLPTYNTGGFMDGSYGNVAYEMGSINFFNYTPEPTLHTTMGNIPAQANYYYKIGEGLTGDFTLSLDLDSDTEATLIIK